MTTTITSKSLTTHDLDALRARVCGPVIGPDDPDYDAARTVWNAMIDRRPALIVRCRGAADVATAIRFARERQLPVSVRGGGHNVAGDAVCDDGVMIDLSLLRGATVDPKSRMARVQPGATWRDLDHETQPFGLAVPGGVVSMTGVAGFALGGGIGWLTRRYGYAADSLIGAELVDANGELHRVDQATDPELLWGLRGGGGNFGVVTSLDFRLHEAGPAVFAGPRAWPVDRAPEVLRCFRELVDSAPDELTMLAIIRIAPQAPWIPAEYHGRPVVILMTFYSGPLQSGPDAVAAMEALGRPVADGLGETTYLEVQGMFDGAWADGFQNYWKAEYLADIPDPAIRAIYEHGRRISSPLSDAKIMQTGGAAARRADESAIGHRAAPMVLNVNSRWSDPAEADRHKEWTAGIYEAMRPYSAGGTYVNFLGGEGDERVRAAYGEKYERLAALKQRIDPDNFFRINQNIRPSG